jgi:hypothetical protein
MALVSSVAPLGAGVTFTSPVEFVQRGTQITGTVFADQNGTLIIEQSGDGMNFDSSVSLSVTADVGLGFEQDIVAQYWQVSFTNTSVTGQTIFRLYADARDPYGDFLAAATGPSSGGAWAVLQDIQGNGSYIFVGRFDGADGWNACANAAISRNQSAKYAAFPVSTATVSDESLNLSTEHNPDSF